jgi:hypothetical protein
MRRQGSPTAKAAGEQTKLGRGVVCIYQSWLQ